MKRITGPKFVKAANAWGVTVFIGTKQTQTWFSTEEEAKTFIQEQNEK